MGSHQSFITDGAFSFPEHRTLSPIGNAAVKGSTSWEASLSREPFARVLSECRYIRRQRNLTEVIFWVVEFEWSLLSSLYLSLFLILKTSSFYNRKATHVIFQKGQQPEQQNIKRKKENKVGPTEQSKL